MHLLTGFNSYLIETFMLFTGVKQGRDVTILYKEAEQIMLQKAK